MKIKNLLFLLIALLATINTRAQSPVIISQPYIFQKYISASDSILLKKILPGVKVYSLAINANGRIIRDTTTAPSVVTSFNGRTGAVTLLSGDVTTALTYTPENLANKSINTALGSSNTLYPSQGAVKGYVDNTVSNYFKLTGGNNGGGNQALSSGDFTTANGKFGSNNTSAGRIGYLYGTKLYDNATGAGGNFIDVNNADNNVQLRTDNLIKFVSGSGDTISFNGGEATVKKLITGGDGIELQDYSGNPTGFLYPNSLQLANGSNYGTYDPFGISLQSATDYAGVQFGGSTLEINSSKPIRLVGASAQVSTAPVNPDDIVRLQDLTGAVGDTTLLARKNGSADMSQKTYTGYSVNVKGSSGVSGFVDILRGTSPAAVTNHLRLYSDSLNRLSWKNSTYRRTIRVGRLADMTISMPYRLNPTVADSTDVATGYLKISDTTVFARRAGNNTFSAQNVFTTPTTISANGINTAATVGLAQTNGTASTAGVQQQFSPAQTFSGTRWRTDLTASETVDFAWQLKPTNGATSSAPFSLSAQVGGGGYSTIASFENTGTGVLRVPTVANMTSTNNSSIQLTNTGTVITQGNSGTNTALVVNNNAGTGNILSLQMAASSVAFFSNTGGLRAPSIGNFAASNNGALNLNTTGGEFRRNIADANPAFTVNNLLGTGDVFRVQQNSVTKMSVDGGGAISINTTPTTSAGTYDILTRNTSTGVVEKILSNTIAFLASPAFTGTPTAPTAAAGTNTPQIATMAALFAERSNTLTYTNKTLTTPKLTGYTVATLPAGTVGMIAYVTDALAPTYLTTVVGGGAITTLVFYNGTNWVTN